MSQMEAEDSAGPAFLNLPHSLVVAIFLLAEAAAPRTLPLVNLVCRAFHEALPDAFAPSGSCDPLSTPDPPDTFPGDAWPPTSPAAGAVAHPVLRFDMALVGAMAARPVSSQAAAAARCTKVGQRFCAARTLCMALSDTPNGVLGVQLFVANIAPHLLNVTRLFLTGLTWSAYLPFWQQPAFSALMHRVRELAVSGQHDAVTTLGAQLPSTCSALTSLSLRIEVSMQAPQVLMLHAPHTLRVLQLALCVTDADADADLDEAVTSVTLAGSPAGLRRLRVRMWECLEGESGDDAGANTLPAVVLNCPAALRELDLTLPHWCICSGSHPALLWLQAVHQACHALARLTLRTGYVDDVPSNPLYFWVAKVMDGGAWHGVMQSLGPLAGSLQQVTLRVVWRVSESALHQMRQMSLDVAACVARAEAYIQSIREAVLAATAEGLPGTNVSVLLVDE